MSSGRGDPGALLRRVLDEPGLVAAVRGLEPRVLGAWVERVGLEDASDLVALASDEQLLQLFDESLWRSERAGDEEHFDPARFAIWLEVLLETGEEAAARRLVELPEELLCLALHSQALVLDLDELVNDLARADTSAAQRIESALEASLTLELDRFLLVSRRHEGWDALATVLSVLDRDEHTMLHGLLERCCAASAEQVDDEGGLLAVLSSAETLEADATADRDDRRARQGYVSRSDARSFLALAALQDVSEILSARDADPITRAYFRERDARAREPEPGAPVAAEPSAQRAGALLLAELRDAEILPDAPLLLAAPEPTLDPLRAGLAELERRDPLVHARRMEELAYLANLVLAGDARSGRAQRPVEAVERVIETCVAGLVQVCGGAPTADAAAQALARVGADRLFRVGWRLAQR